MVALIIKHIRAFVKNRAARERKREGSEGDKSKIHYFPKFVRRIAIGSISLTSPALIAEITRLIFSGLINHPLLKRPSPLLPPHILPRRNKSVSLIENGYSTAIVVRAT